MGFRGFSAAIELVAGAEALAPLVIKWWDSLEIWEQDKSKPFNEHSHHNTFMILYAFAIQNYCKGVLAWHLKAGERQRLRTEGKFPKRLQTHDVLALVTSVGLPAASIEEEATLRRLTDAAVWAGRYPVSTDYRGNIKAVFSDGKSYGLSYLARSDVEDVRALAAHVRDHVGARASNRSAKEND